MSCHCVLVENKSSSPLFNPNQWEKLIQITATGKDAHFCVSFRLRGSCYSSDTNYLSSQAASTPGRTHTVPGLVTIRSGPWDAEFYATKRLSSELKCTPEKLDDFGVTVSLQKGASTPQHGTSSLGHRVTLHPPL